MMKLEEENKQVFYFVQALLGAISPNFRAASILVDSAGVTLNFLLAEESQEDRDEIEDVEFEFIAFQSGPVSVKTQIAISTRPFGEVPLAGRLVFLRREPRANEAD